VLQVRRRSQIRTHFLAAIHNALSSPLRDCQFELAEQEDLEMKKLNVKHSLMQRLILYVSTTVSNALDLLHQRSIPNAESSAFIFSKGGRVSLLAFLLAT
jgi:hypothetical protein